MANVTTKFKVEVDGIDKFITDLDQANGIINELTNSLPYNSNH